jgi:hypothetical protein
MSPSHRPLLIAALLLPLACESGQQQRSASLACDQAAARLTECGRPVPSSFYEACDATANPAAAAAIALVDCDELSAALSDSFELKADQTTFTCEDLRGLTRGVCAVLQASPTVTTTALPASLATLVDPQRLKELCADVQRENFCGTATTAPGTPTPPAATPATPVVPPGPPCADDNTDANDDAISCAVFRQPGQRLVCRPTFSTGFDVQVLDPATGRRRIPKFCLPPANARQRCEAAEDCWPGLVCSNRNAQGVAMCGLPAEGTPCSGNDNAYCRGLSLSGTLVCRPSRRYASSVCLARAAAGELCTPGDNGDCANGQCSAAGVCASPTSGPTAPVPPPVGNQQACTETATVSDRPGAAGKPCTGTNVCRPSGDPRFVDTTVCLNPGGSGDRCVDDYDCATRPTWLTCSGGFCR